MVLAPRNLTLRLLARGLLAPSEVLHGGLTLENVSHRNHDTLVRRREKAILFVKEARDDRGAVDREVAVFRELRRLAPLRPLLPSLRHHEPGLIVLSVAPGESLAARAAPAGRVPPPAAAALGHALAALHRSGAAVPEAAIPEPWIFSLAAPPLEILKRASAANLEILRIVRSSREIRSGLATLKKSWRKVAPLHNDVRLENCIARRADGRWRLKLVDWELAAPGDPVWDLGCGLAAFAALWIFSLRFLPGMNLDQLVKSALVPVGRVRPSARAFYDAYAGAMGVIGGPRDGLLTRAIRFAGARLLQLSWERTVYAHRLSADVICAVQAAANFLEHPEAAASILLGPEAHHDA